MNRQVHLINLEQKDVVESEDNLYVNACPGSGKTRVLTRKIDLHSAFALMMPAGFAGGHGYAASIGGTLQDITGWEEAITIGQTFATIGLILGVLIDHRQRH